MNSEIFYWLFNMSISASITGIIILLLSKIRRIPRRIISILWIIPLIRMWLPIAINSKYSIMSLVVKKTVPVHEGPVDFSMINHVMVADTYFPTTYKTNLLKKVFQVASVLWIVIGAVLLIAMIIAYAATKFQLKDAKHFRDNIYLSGKITSPAAYGIFHGRIILPEVYEKKDLNFVLMHENTHIKRKDNLWRLVAIITACIHWFNPMSWLFLKAFLSNIELACDETVLAQCGDDEKKNYALALLNCAESKTLYGSAFGGAGIRLRINYILSYKGLSVLSIICFVILSVVIGYVLLTNAI